MNTSSSLGFLVRHLSGKGFVRGVFEAGVSSFQLKYFALRNFHPNKEIWALNSSLDVGLRNLYSRSLSRKLEQFCKDFDILLQVGSEFSLRTLASRLGKPSFSYHDDNVFRYFNSRMMFLDGPPSPRLKARFRRAMCFEKSVYDGLDGVLCMTEYLRNIFISEFDLPEDKVHCIGFGANLDTPDVSGIERDFSSPSLLFIAKDSFEEKGGGIVLDAFKRLRKKYKDAKLVIVGQKKNMDIDGVTWAGFLDKRQPEEKEKFISIFKSSTLFVMPSFVEAAGGAFLEAMSYGLPCIGANQGSTPEIIVQRGAGLVLDQPDGKELADKIDLLHSDPVLLKEMGEKGRLAVEKYYNWDVVCDKAEKIFRKSLA